MYHPQAGPSIESNGDDRPLSTGDGGKLQLWHESESKRHISNWLLIRTHQLQQPLGSPRSLSAATTATLHPSQIRLCDLDHVSMRHLFCHREQDALAFSDNEDAFMTRLVESLLGEGQQVPVEFYRDAAGHAILLRGYQRVAACHHIVERGLDPGRFNAEMIVDAVEVKCATSQDLLIRSISDNEVRRSLSESEQYIAARQMVEAGVSTQRAARALGLSPTSFARLHKRITHPEIQAHAESGHIGQTDLDSLLEVAASHGATDRVGAELAGVVTAVEDHINNLRARAQLNGEEFDEAKAGAVKRYIKPDQVRAWVTAIKEGKALTWADPDKEEVEDKSWICKLDVEEGLLQIGSLKKNLFKSSPEELGKISFKMNRVAALVERWWYRRRAEAGIAAATAGVDGEDYDAYLERHGATEEARKVRAARTLTRGEDDPAHGRVDPRAETDLASRIVIQPLDPGPDPGAEYDPMIDA